MMTRLSVTSAILLSFAFGTAWAQDPTPPPSSTPSAADKAAIAKSCTDQANAKGLHGKARKKFRSECKHKGGKVE
jgi:hypothetical protein